MNFDGLFSDPHVAAHEADVERRSVPRRPPWETQT